MLTTEYTVICQELAHELARRVNKLLGNGWELLGTPFVRGAQLCQAMDRRTKVAG